MSALVLWVSLPYVARAWAVAERSPEASGLPAVFLLKTAIPLFAALLIVQTAAEIARATAVLTAPQGRGRKR